MEKTRATDAPERLIPTKEQRRVTSDLTGFLVEYARKNSLVLVGGIDSEPRLKVLMSLYGENRRLFFDLVFVGIDPGVDGTINNFSTIAREICGVSNGFRLERVGDMNGLIKFREDPAVSAKRRFGRREFLPGKYRFYGISNDKVEEFLRRLSLSDELKKPLPVGVVTEGIRAVAGV